MLGSCSSSSAAAAATVMASPPLKYDVFLSFRGEDTRDNFTSHLYDGLCRKKVQTFIDYRLDKGDEISPELCKAIEESMIYVILFSQDYASSRWCLDELAKILECKKKYGRDVIPVFYKVDPSNVRHQKGCYADAFVKHEERFQEEVIHRWKDALTRAAGLSGWDSNTARPESLLVDGIVKDILRKMGRCFSSDIEGMVGIDKHIAPIQSLLQLESKAVRIIGIWGMGGIGKSTLARALHNKLATQFRFRSCIINAQQEIEKVGVDSLRKKYISELLEEVILPNGLDFAIERVKRAKVLLILDDLKNASQVQELIGGHGNFGHGSRIILTSRDIQVLKNAEADGIYEVKGMNSQDSWELFTLNAFKQNYPVQVNSDLVEKVLKYAQGVPLALKVLGSLLYGRTRKAWESELQKLEKLPDVEIFNVLRLSYDGLDDEQKDIFLDIACFYVGGYVYEVAEVLDGCGFSADIGVDVLIDRCLISILDDQIVVHDLMLEMGIEIVRQQCVTDPGKRSRLWKHEEIYHVFRKNKGTDAIQCIFLDMCQIKEVQLHPNFFKSLPNMRMLYFHKYSSFGKGQSNLILPASLDTLPDGLKVLHWDRFPQRSLPLDFYPENLVRLDMRSSSLEKLWEEDQELPNLKRLDLTGSRNLIRIPDLSNSPNIEEIILSHCESLIQVYSSSFLSKLKLLYLTGCVELRILNIPSNILSRSSGLVSLYNCYKLESFSLNITGVVDGFDANSHWTCPEGNSGYQQMNGGRMEEIYSTDLELFRESTPSQFFHELCWLDLDSCVSLTSLPLNLCKLKCLRRLYLSGCSNLETFPEIEETMENLVGLDLSGTAIKELPSSLDRLVRLEELNLRKCSRLEIIPSSIGRLTKLSKLELTGCESLETFPSIIFKMKLTVLNFDDFSKLKTFPEILEPGSFAYISLAGTAIKELPSSLDCLVCLQTLSLDQCRDLESLPSSIGNLKLLSELDCSGCCKLTEIPNDIGRLSMLRKLSLQYTGIVNLPESIAHLSSLESLDLSGTGIVNLVYSIAHLSSLKLLDVSDCQELECIPQLPPFLKELLALDCPSIKRVMPNSWFKLPSNSKDTFSLYFTNNEEQDPSAHSDVMADAWLRITNAYKFVFYCFPGSVVPDWFPYRCEGNSVTVDIPSLNWCNENSPIGFAMCVVLRLENMMKDSVNRFDDFSCRLTFESVAAGTQTLPEDGDGQLHESFCWSGRQMRHVTRDHTFLWKYYLMDSTNIDKWSFHAFNFTFGIYHPWLDFKSSLQHQVKECGICPLYSKEKDDDIGGVVDSSSFRRVYTEESSRKRPCLGWNM